MLRKATFGMISLAALGLMLTTASTSEAQSFRINLGKVQIGPVQVAARHYHVEWRQPFWKERDFDCPIEAREFAHRKRSEGFEAHVVRHGSHYHVRYRMLHWHPYRTVYNHSQAHHLEDMLQSRGLQARVVHH